MTKGEITAGMMPSFTSVKPKIASSVAIAMSQTAARPAPPPKAAPWTRPTTGFRAVIDRAKHVAHSLGVGDVCLERQIERGAHPIDIGAPAEDRAFTGEHDRAHIVGRGDARKDFVKLLDYLGIESIADLRPCKRDAGDAVADG